MVIKAKGKYTTPNLACPENRFFIHGAGEIYLVTLFFLFAVREIKPYPTPLYYVN